MLLAYPVYTALSRGPDDADARALLADRVFASDFKKSVAAICNLKCRQISLECDDARIRVVCECYSAVDQQRVFHLLRDTFTADDAQLDKRPLPRYAASHQCGEPIVSAPLAEFGLMLEDLQRRLCSIRLDMLTRLRWQGRVDPWLVKYRCSPLIAEVAARLQYMSDFCSEHNFVPHYKEALALFRADVDAYYDMHPNVEKGMAILRNIFRVDGTEQGTDELKSVYRMLHVSFNAGLKWKEINALASLDPLDSLDVHVGSKELGDALAKGKRCFTWNELATMRLLSLRTAVCAKAGSRRFTQAAWEDLGARLSAMQSQIQLSVEESRRSEETCLVVL